MIPTPRLRILFDETERALGRDRAIEVVVEASRAVPRGVKDVVAQVAAEHGVTGVQIMGRSTQHEISKARRAVWARLWCLGFSKSRIGRLFGRDHSTVIHGINRHANADGRTLSEDDGANSSVGA